jgi:hypothetical protein
MGKYMGEDVIKRIPKIDGVPLPSFFDNQVINKYLYILRNR